MGRDPKKVLGDINEFRAIIKFLNEGYMVFKNVSGTGPIDLVLVHQETGEIRKIDSRSMATIGVLSNPDQKNIKIGKAGRSRWLGIRPHTRGVVKNPVDHPHGGGEGKSAGGRHPVSPTGQSAKGLKTRDNKRTDKFIIRRRKKKRGK